MEQLYSPQNYFSTQQNRKSREQELVKKLRERLPHSDLRETLFEYLVVRRGVLKEQMIKEPDQLTQGRGKELRELIDLFAPDVTQNE